jgi:hypothetical protein
MLRKQTYWPKRNNTIQFGETYMKYACTVNLKPAEISVLVHECRNLSGYEDKSVSRKIHQYMCVQWVDIRGQ